MPHVTIDIDNATQLYQLFRDYDRQNQFSYQGLEWLYDWIEEREDYIGESYAIDVVGLCCDWSEESYEEVASNYSIDLPPREDYADSDAYDEAVRETVIDYLNDHTPVAGYDDDSVLYANF